MPELNRRRFLQIAGATAGFAALSSSIDRAAAIPAQRRSGTIKDVEHIVVLMQENRSFDHYFGALQGRTRLRRPAPGRRCPAASRSGTSPTAPRTCCRSTRTPRTSACSSSQGLDHDWAGGHKAWNNGKYDQWIPAKTAGDDGVPDARGHPVPLRARRRVHHLRRVPLLVHRRHRPQPLLHVDRLHRQRRQGRRPGPRQRRGRLRLDDVPRAAGAGRGLLEDLPGHRRRPGRGRLLGLDRATPTAATTATTPCCTSTSTATPSPATRCTTRPAPARTPRPATATSTSSRPTCRPASSRRSPGSPRPRPSPSTRTGPPNYGAWYIAQVLDALTSNPEVWSKTALFITYDENDGFFDHVVAAVPAGLGRAGPVDRRHRARRALHRATPATPPVRTASASACPMLVVSPWSTGGYVCSEVFDHTSIIRFMEQPLRRAASRTSRRGAAPSAAT